MSEKIKIGETELKFKSKLRKRLFKTFVCLIIWLLLAVPIILWFQLSTEARKAPKEFEFYSDSNTNDRVDVNLKIDAVTLDKRQVTIAGSIIPQGSLRLNNTSMFSRDVETNWFYFNKKFEKSKPNEPLSFPVYLDSGNVRDYPFDKYEFTLPLKLKGVSNFKLSFSTLTQNYKYKLTPKDQSIQVTIVRSSTTYLFCFFISLLMWMLSITMLNLGWGSLVKKRDPPAPVLGVGISILFALPTLRASQPAIPSIGCFIDIFAFFWALFFVGFSSIVIIVCWVLRWKK